MFIGKKYDFQFEHVDNLLKACADHKEMVLYAPTGSGKTVMASKFIDDYLDENPNTVFLWLCPGAGALHIQSMDSFSNVTSGISFGNVYSFISEPEPKGQVFFINWDKINRNSNVVLREGEHKDLMSRVYSCHNSGIDIFMIIDEEHKYKDTANEYIHNINPKHVLRISATPITDTDYTEVVKDDDVISAGLIATNISINEGVSQVMQEENNMNDDLLLISIADEKRKEIQKEYKKRGIKVNPLVLIQFPNGNEEWIERVKKHLSSMGYSENSGLSTSWFSGDHPDNPEEIKKLDGQYAFLLFKQAIATGWDCPRAKILVKLREGGTEQFNIQTVGRIRRTPKKELYDVDLIDNCYIYTLDKKFNEGLTNSINEHFYSYQHKKKCDAPDILLKKESLNGSDRYAVNPKAVIKAVHKTMISSCDLNKDGCLDRDELHRRGYAFGDCIRSEVIEGIARTTHDMLKLHTNSLGERQIDSNDGFIIRDAKRKIAQSMGIDENISSKALKVLFGPLEKISPVYSKSEQDFEKQYKLIGDMTLREYNAFLVNNRDRLISVFSNLNKEDIGDIERTEKIVSDWSVPEYQYYRQHKKIPSTAIMKKNMFENYGNNIFVQKNRSEGEKEIERWSETNDAVEWIYKNGDKGDEFFSIVYYRGFCRSHFYPDYILKLKNGDIWIIEAKGGIKADGTSNNVDTYANHKFEALKEYGERHPELKWGFVRAVGTQLYLSNTVWDENVTNGKVWKPIEEFIQ